MSFDEVLKSYVCCAFLLIKRNQKEYRLPAVEGTIALRAGFRVEGKEIEEHTSRRRVENAPFRTKGF